MRALVALVLRRRSWGTCWYNYYSRSSRVALATTEASFLGVRDMTQTRPRGGWTRGRECLSTEILTARPTSPAYPSKTRTLAETLKARSQSSPMHRTVVEEFDGRCCDGFFSFCFGCVVASHLNHWVPEVRHFLQRAYGLVTTFSVYACAPHQLELCGAVLIQQLHTRP